MSLIKSQAARWGESNPTSIEWVSAKRSAITNLLDFGVTAGDPNQEQTLVVAKGIFKRQLGSILSGSRPPSGTTMTLVIDPETSTISDLGVRPGDLNISELGPVSTE